MSDWADEETLRLTKEFRCKGVDDEFCLSIGCCFMDEIAEIAAALRKAKADGLREAGEIIDGFLAHIAAPEREQVNVSAVQNRADAIRFRASRVEQPR